VCPGSVQWCPAATLLLGIPGLVVTKVAEGEDGWLTADVETHPDLREQARLCHGCGMRGIIKERPETEPRTCPRTTGRSGCDGGKCAWNAETPIARL
jgi:hypothetical protein